VLGNDTDSNEDAMTATLVDGPAQGTLTLNPDGSFTYTPVPDMNGAVTFTYQASDAAAESEPATVTLTVTPVNDAPVATDDDAATVENARVEVPVTKNDADVEGDALTAVPVSVPAHGIATCSGGTCTYAPAEGFTGRDAFTYAVSDDRGGSDRAQLRITVVPVGTPEAADDLVTTPEDTEVRVDVLANDVLGDQPTAVASRPPARGTLLGGEGGSFTYRPAPDDDKDVEFTYTLTDADRQRSSARVRITITPVNDPPSLPPGASYSTGQDRPLVVGAPDLLAGHRSRRLAGLAPHGHRGRPARRLLLAPSHRSDPRGSLCRQPGNRHLRPHALPFRRRQQGDPVEPGGLDRRLQPLHLPVHSRPPPPREWLRRPDRQWVAHYCRSALLCLRRPLPQLLGLLPLPPPASLCLHRRLRFRLTARMRDQEKNPATKSVRTDADLWTRRSAPSGLRMAGVILSVTPT
jgi:VCBS repeat-containing protein